VPKLTATLDTCTAADDGATADDSSADDDFVDTDDEDFSGDDFNASASSIGDEGEDAVDLDDSDDVSADTSACDDEDLEKGAVLTSAELHKDGGAYYLVSYELA